MSQILWNAVVVGLVTIVFDLVFFYCITRREQRRDDQDKAQDNRIKELEDKLEDFREREILALKREFERGLEDLRDDVDVDGSKRGAIYKRIEETLISRRECNDRHTQLNETLAKIDRSICITNAELADLSKKMAIVDLIAAHLNIKIGG